MVIDFEKEKRKRYYPHEDGFHEFVQVIIPIRKTEDEKRYLDLTCAFLTNSEFFHDEMQKYETQEKFLGDLSDYFLEYQRQITEREEGTYLIMNLVDETE